MPARVVYSISDLHLGGAPPEGGEVGFELCPPAMRRLLARFIHQLADRGRHDEDVELVVNGDFVDFLAEESDGGTPDAPAFVPFEQNPDRARAKLLRVIERVDRGAPEGEQVFPAFRRYCQDGNRLTVLLGNHDLELCLPGVREVLVTALTGDAPARLTFVDDGRAWRVGPAVFDHGNRADGWNQVLHDRLRRTRSALSRGETCEMSPPPGSELVVDVMNPMKRRYRFIDLLKPEEEAVPPVLLALMPYWLGDARGLGERVRRYGALSEQLSVLSGLRWQAREAEQTPGRQPTRLEAISGTRPMPDASPPDETALIREIACLSLGRSVSSTAPPGGPTPVSGSFGGPRAIAQLVFDDAPLRHVGLRRAFRAWEDTFRRTFEMDVEAPKYLEAARSLTSRGAELVVFGHTHLAKRITLDGGGVYLNTGTWCPVIRVPDGFLKPAEDEGAEEQIQHEILNFIMDLEANVLEPWTQAHGLFARVVLDDRADSVREAELLEILPSGEWVAFEGYPAPTAQRVRSPKPSTAS